MLLIGIAGYKRSGKDTVAKLLIEHLSVLNIKAERRALADALKEEAARFLADYFCPKYTYEQYLDWMHGRGTDEQKEQYRLLMQWWGTEGKRMHFRNDYWLVALEEYIPQSDAAVLMVPDVRFRNEVEFVKSRNGIMIYVERPGYGGENHPSEKDLDEYTAWDYTIQNDGEMEHLEKQVRQISNIIYSRLIV